VRTLPRSRAQSVSVHTGLYDIATPCTGIWCWKRERVPPLFLLADAQATARGRTPAACTYRVAPIARDSLVRMPHDRFTISHVTAVGDSYPQRTVSCRHDVSQGVCMIYTTGCGPRTGGYRCAWWTWEVRLNFGRLDARQR